MSEQTLLQRYRLFLFLLTGAIFIGVLVELYFTEHTESLPQWIPFVLSGLGLVALVGVLVRPQRAMILALRGVMGLVTLGSFFGIFEHIEHNLEFALEIRPNAVASDVFFEALGGPNPLLAPGILALGALLALAATYYHPALNKK
ncbi:MAG: hypothetical protein HUU38_18620 [Anaerolineales bacterium]|jgi:hypothetical protein|nr:hypothetical protein [Anaerolineales bacterium]